MGQRVVSGVIWSYMQAWVARGVTTFGFLIIGVFLSPHEFGLFALVSAWLMLCELLCEQATSQMIVQLSDVDDDHLTASLLLSLGLALLFSAVMFFGAEPIADFFKADGLIALLKFAAIYPFLIGISAVPTGLIKRELAFKVLTQRTVLASSVATLFGIGLAISGVGAWALMLQSLVFYLISAAVLWRHSTWRPRTIPPIRLLPRIARLVAANVATKFLDYLETKGVELLVGRMAGITELGVFAFASKIAQTAFQTVASPFLEVMFASLARSRDNKASEGMIQKGLLLMACAPAPVLFGLAVGAFALLNGVYGLKWADAVLPLAALVAAYFLRAFLYVFGASLLALRHSHAAVMIAGVRAVVCLVGAFVLVKSGYGALGAALAYLFAALVIVPVSAFGINKMTHIPMKSLIAVPVKAMLAGLAGAALFIGLNTSLRHGMGDVPAAAVAAFVSAGVFLFLSILLNARLLALSLRRETGNGNVARLAKLLLAITVVAITFREWLWLIWFRWSLKAGLLFGAKRQDLVAAGPLVVPADTAELDGSLGDQAMMLGLSTLVDWKLARIVTSERFVTSEVFADHRFLRAWDGLLAGWRLGRAARDVTCLYIIGADVMDGYYSPVVSIQRIALVEVYARHGIQTIFTGFSFNERPSKSVIKAFRHLPDSVHICLRDEVSLQRFESTVGRKATLVADLAFLLLPELDSMVARQVTDWAIQQHNMGQRVLGINVNPQVVAHLQHGTEMAIASSVAESSRELLRQRVSIAFIPHDFRPGCADLRVLSIVRDMLEGIDTSRVMFLTNEFSAREIKAACRPFDLVMSARMHLAIGALSVGTPVCGIQYQGKFEGLFRHFDLDSDLFISPEDALDKQRLTKFILKHLAQAEAYRRILLSKMPKVIEFAGRNVA